jgi:hypothetical protein
VYIKESEVTTGLISAVDDMPDGNVMLIVINDENKVISMMDKPKQIKYSFIEQNNLSILV